MKTKTKKIIVATTLLLFLILALFPFNINASDSEIKKLTEQIGQKRNELSEIDKEIEKQRRALQEVSGRSNTLQNTLQQLEASRKKLLSDIDRTEIKILEAELMINKLTLEINQREGEIKRATDSLAHTIRKYNELNTTSFVEKLLMNKTISDFWLDFEQTQTIQKRLNQEIESLTKLKKDLEQKELEKQSERQDLSMYKTELSSEQESVEYTKKQQAELLTKTKNEEAAYQRILAQNLKRKQDFEKELLDIESKLNILIDPKSFPAPKNGILSWPLDSIRITQQFGGTQFAKSNPHIYGRPFHPGTDFGAPIGTRIKSVYSGKVIGAGNTDAYPGCYAWGKWIVVQHPNGLSSLYAHLSSISVSVGQEVQTGQIIGLSGNTGVSTGPHLHLTIYASQGLRIGKYGDYRPGGTGCAATNATGPFADLSAYLDPMLYLPKL